LRISSLVVVVSVSADLDEQHKLSRDTESIIGELQQRYRNETALGSLRIKHKENVGYFVEMSSDVRNDPKMAERIPSHWRFFQLSDKKLRYQTKVSAKGRRKMRQKKKHNRCLHLLFAQHRVGAHGFGDAHEGSVGDGTVD
jgi:DNA mismatch repair ATPase MutS